jgi:phosphoribosylglycinamide formyltransferase-1
MSAGLAVLVSGSGSNLQSLLDAQKADALAGAKIVLVLSDNPKSYALTRAEQAGVQALVIRPKDYATRADWERAVGDALDAARVDWVLLAGFLRIFSGDFVRRFAGRILNIHPSLLPKYGGEGFYGLKVHEAVLAGNEKESGASVHFVTEGCDEGPVILQEKVAVYQS